MCYQIPMNMKKSSHRSLVSMPFEASPGLSGQSIAEFERKLERLKSQAKFRGLIEAQRLLATLAARILWEAKRRTNGD